MTNQDNSSPGDIKHSQWQLELEAVLRDPDPETLRQRVDAAEAALFLRLQELIGRTDAEGERKAIAEAIQRLRTVQTEKLGYPDWNKK